MCIRDSNTTTTLFKTNNRYWILDFRNVSNNHIRKYKKFIGEWIKVSVIIIQKEKTRSKGSFLDSKMMTFVFGVVWSHNTNFFHSFKCIICHDLMWNVFHNYTIISTIISFNFHLLSFSFPSGRIVGIMESLVRLHQTL